MIVLELCFYNLKLIAILDALLGPQLCSLYS